MSQGDIMIMHGRVHGFINTSIIWYDRPFEPEICFKQFPSKRAVELFAEEYELTVLEEAEPVTLPAGEDEPL
jgi:hypothetical protein